MNRYVPAEAHTHYTHTNHKHIQYTNIHTVTHKYMQTGTQSLSTYLCHNNYDIILGSRTCNLCIHICKL